MTGLYICGEGLGMDASSSMSVSEGVGSVGGALVLGGARLLRRARFSFLRCMFSRRSCAILARMACSSRRRPGDSEVHSRCTGIVGEADVRGSPGNFGGLSLVVVGRWVLQPCCVC